MRTLPFLPGFSHRCHGHNLEILDINNCFMLLSSVLQNMSQIVYKYFIFIIIILMCTERWRHSARSLFLCGVWRSLKVFFYMKSVKNLSCIWMHVLNFGFLMSFDHFLSKQWFSSDPINAAGSLKCEGGRPAGDLLLSMKPAASVTSLMCAAGSCRVGIRETGQQRRISSSTRAFPQQNRFNVTGPAPRGGVAPHRDSVAPSDHHEC